MRSIRTLGVIIVMACMFSLYHPSLAQEIPGRVATIDMSQVSLDTGRAPNQTSDVFFGSGGKGPYVLSWNQINRFSEWVTVDGTNLQSTLDYNVDYASGTITFNQPLGSTQVARVQYTCNFATATRNPNAVKIPIRADLFSSGSSCLSFTAVSRDGAGKGSAPLAYGLSGSTKTKIGDFSALFLTAPSSDENSSQSFGARSAFKVADTAKAGMLQLDTSYAHAGQDFIFANDYGLQQGQNVFDLRATASPTKAWTFLSDYKQSESLMPGTEGEINTTYEQKLAYAPLAGPKITIDHVQADSGQSGQTLSSSNTDQLKVQQALSKTFSADAQLTNTDSSASGSADDIALNVNASPAKTLNVKAGVDYSTSALSGQAASESVAVTHSPNQAMSMSVNVTHSSDSADTTPSSVKVQTNVEVIPLQGTKIGGGYTQVTQDGGGVLTQATEVHATLGAVSLKGGYAWNNGCTAGDRTITASLGADLHLSPQSLLSTTYSCEQDNSLTGTQTHIYALTFSHRVAAEMNVYLTASAKLVGQNQQLSADQCDYEGAARFGMKF
jgi:hypothetical protein